jgi:hypothetical protein
MDAVHGLAIAMEEAGTAFPEDHAHVHELPEPFDEMARGGRPPP